MAKALTKQPKSLKMLHSFVNYCLENPEERFFQALTNWSKEHIKLQGGGVSFVMVGNHQCFPHMMESKCPFVDTFYFENDSFKD